MGQSARTTTPTSHQPPTKRHTIFPERSLCIFQYCVSSTYSKLIKLSPETVKVKEDRRFRDTGVPKLLADIGHP